MAEAMVGNVRVMVGQWSNCAAWIGARDRLKCGGGGGGRSRVVYVVLYGLCQ